MFKHILIPLDGSSLAEAILPVAKFLAACLHARVTFLHVVEPAAPATIHGEPHLMKADDATVYLARVARQFSEAGIEVATHVDIAASGDVVKAIFAHGGELNADLILLTNHGRSGVREIVFGNIAQHVLQSGKIPVLLVKAETEPAVREFKCERILVPLDSSALYEPSLEVAVSLARACRATLQLIVVVPTLSTLSPERSATGLLLPSSTQAVLNLAERGAMEYLAQWLEKLKDEKIEASAQVLRGETVSMILRAAEHASADLIVMATHGRAGLGAFWSGSVAPNVLRHAKIPILLLRVTGDESVR